MGYKTSFEDPFGIKWWKSHFSVQPGIVGTVNCWLLVIFSFNMAMRHKWEFSVCVKLFLYHFNTLFRAVCTEIVNQFQHFYPCSWRLHCTRIEVWPLSVHKNTLLWWSYQLSFSKRPEETQGDQGLHAQSSVSHSSPAWKAAALVIVYTGLLFNISHRIAVCLSTANLYLSSHTWMHQKMLAWKQYIVYNGRNPKLTSPTSKYDQQIFLDTSRRNRQKESGENLNCPQLSVSSTVGGESYFNRHMNCARENREGCVAAMKSLDVLGASLRNGYSLSKHCGEL